MTLAVNVTSDVADMAGNTLASSVTSSVVTVDHMAPMADTIMPVNGKSDERHNHRVLG